MLAAVFWVGASHANAAILTQLSSPGQIAGGTTLNFDNLVAGTFANSAYLSQGVQFSIGSGNILVYDWTSLGRSTTSPRNVMAAVSSGGSSFSSFIDVIFSQPTIAVGAYMGNDQGLFSTFDLELFDAGNVSLGAVQVVANQNTQVDQFVGVSSDTPFVRARFKNFPPVGLSAVLDDVTFLTHASAVPEASTIVVWSVLCMLFAWKGFPRKRLHLE